jgi:hypothetical protein
MSEVVEACVVSTAQHTEICDTQIDCHSQEMGHLMESVRVCLERLEEALIVTCKVEAAIGTNSPTRCIEQFLEDYYDLKDPEGVAERLRENRTVEAQFCDKEINYLGHLLVGDPAEFSRRLQETTSGVSAELVRFVGTFSSSSQACPILSYEDYEAAYGLCDGLAFVWQELLDDETLLQIRRLLREHVRETECLLYLE